MPTLTTEIIRQWLKFIEDNKEFHYTKVLDGQVDPTSYPRIRNIVFELVQSKEIKSCGRKDGFYRKIKKVVPVDWLQANPAEYFDLAFPMGRGGDNSSFDFEEHIKVSPGDLIMLTGVSNAGKTALALNFLAENIDKHPCVLMGNEYTAMGDTPSPKFKRRMMAMDWVSWVDSENKSRFDLLPVKQDFEDYIQKDKINIIDWINLRGEFWEIGAVLEDIKDRVGKGIVIAVLQKSREKELGRGGQFTEDRADVYFTIDPFGDWQSRLTVGKVKEPKGHITGRSWAFRIVEGGAKLHNIREVVKCSTCHGMGFTKAGKCIDCRGYKYVEGEA